MPREAAHHGESCSKWSVGFTHGGSCGGYRRGVKRVEIAGRGVVGHGLTVSVVPHDPLAVGMPSRAAAVAADKPHGR